jgi:hypothetical protein
MERSFGYVGARSVAEIGPHIFAHAGGGKRTDKGTESDSPATEPIARLATVTR